MGLCSHLPVVASHDMTDSKFISIKAATTALGTGPDGSVWLATAAGIASYRQEHLRDFPSPSPTERTDRRSRVVERWFCSGCEPAPLSCCGTEVMFIPGTAVSSCRERACSRFSRIRAVASGSAPTRASSRYPPQPQAITHGLRVQPAPGR